MAQVAVQLYRTLLVTVIVDAEDEDSAVDLAWAQVGEREARGQDPWDDQDDGTECVTCAKCGGDPCHAGDCR